MQNKSYEDLYNWEILNELFKEFVPELTKEQSNVKYENSVSNLPIDIKKNLEEIGFSNEAKDPKQVARQLIDEVYPYRMKLNHPRHFCFIPDALTPYSVFGEFLNSIHNPYGGASTISEGTATIEKETIYFMGSLIGYDRDKLGGLFVSGGSMANLTAAIIARDDKLSEDDYLSSTVYISDQTHSSMAKALHIIGIPKRNIKKISSDKNFKMNTKELEKNIKEDLQSGLKPFLVVGSAGTTNTGSIDPIDEISRIATKYNMWFHLDGAYGASALLSSHRDNLKGIEKADSITWDGHKWLFQTYGCAAIICKNHRKMLNSFHTNPEYLKDVESRADDYNFWDLGIELTRPARGVKLWYTLQSVGLDTMRDAIDQGFIIADWIEDEVKKYDDFEIVSKSQMGIINFRYFNSKFSEDELNIINQNISNKAIEKNYASFLTTILNGKTVIRFCCNNALTTKEEIINIVNEIRSYIDEEIK